MNRLLAIVVHNWPLKLAAVGLATVLYGGLILSQDTQTFPGPIPISQVNPPANMHIEDLPPVTSVRYFAPAGADRPGQGTFRASVDLGGLPERAGTYDVRVQVTSVNPQIQIRGVEPEFVSVTLDPLVTKIVPVTINYGEPPSPMEVGLIRAEPSTVTVTGQQSVVDQVVAARADVQIPSTGINVDQEVTLVPVDALGNPRSPAGVSPTTARIRVQVLSEPDTRTLPIDPVITGTPAAGFELESITVTPPTATVKGDIDRLSALATLDTEPISISGRSEAEEFPTQLALPDDIVRDEEEPIVVTLTFRPVTESRTFTGGLDPSGETPGLTYTFDMDRILLVVGGTPAALDALTARGGPVGSLDVTGLVPGTYDVPVSATLEEGLTLVTASPATVSVTIAAPLAPSASPTSSPAP